MPTTIAPEPPGTPRRTTARPPVRTLLSGLILAVLLTACAAGPDGVVANPDQTADPPASGTVAGEAGVTFSEVDIAFLRGMIPHHAQAVEMAELVEGRTAHPEELGALADAIVGTQQLEIEAMNALLEQAGEEPVDSAAEEDGMDHSAMGDSTGDVAMGGMMTADALDALAEAEGEAFDGMFLEMMIAHHEGAIGSAQQVVDQEDGGNADVLALAEAIITAQEAEITQMQGWQQEWEV